MNLIYFAIEFIEGIGHKAEVEISIENGIRIESLIFCLMLDFNFRIILDLKLNSLDKILPWELICGHHQIIGNFGFYPDKKHLEWLERVYPWLNHIHY